MSWTKDQPTEPGYYWVKFPPHTTPSMVSLYKHNDDLCVYDDVAASFLSIKTWDCEWFGPITPPK